MAQGIILAAGYSSRAKTNKMLLMFEHKSLILHAIDGMMPFVSHIFVVTGHYHQEIEHALKDLKHVTCIYNKDYQQGMFSSVQIGVSVIQDDFFILPGDCPFVHPTTFALLIGGDKEVRVPCFMGRKGHPLYLLKHLKQKILNAPSSSNLKYVRNQCDVEIVTTDDPNILTDIDTVEDYLSLEKPKGKESFYGN